MTKIDKLTRSDQKKDKQEFDRFLTKLPISLLQDQFFFLTTSVYSHSQNLNSNYKATHTSATKISTIDS